MANSIYEYVKSFEVEDEVMFPNVILVCINGRNFTRFSQLHHLEKPYDLNALKLMNSCAVSVLEEYADVVLAYGFNDGYTFVFNKSSKFYQRRANKVLSVISYHFFFPSMFVTKWSDFFPQKELQYAPSFQAHVISCATIQVLLSYFLWRQNICHVNNQYDQCFWRLVKCGKTETDAHNSLKVAEISNLNERLFHEFDINYNTLEEIYRQGSCVLKKMMKDVVKYAKNDTPVRRCRRKITTVHKKKIASKRFWNDQTILLKELGGFVEEIDNVKSEYVRTFEFDSKLMPSTWIVVRLDGCHFQRFSEIHEFMKPNDERALNLMNSCTLAVLEEFRLDIVFAYWVSDEYSFMLKRTTDLYQRRASKIISAIVSFFTSTYVMRWQDYFPNRKLNYPPSFDGRAVCYPSTEILRDYLSWRQVECHINNQYNTCFWKLDASGKSKREAQQSLKGAQLQTKIEELAIEYNKLPIMFRQGSSVFRDRADNVLIHQENGKSSECYGKVIVEYIDIIGSAFWLEHPGILDEKQYV